MPQKAKKTKKPQASVLVVDDERPIRSTLEDILTLEGYSVQLAENGKQALTLYQQEKVDLVLCDIKMPGMDGVEVLEALLAIRPTPIIMVSGHGTIETAVQAVRLGAFDYIEKPLDLNRLLTSLREALSEKKKPAPHKPRGKTNPSSTGMIGESPALQEIQSIIARVAPTPSRVLITGENGTGKELVAREIHAQSLLAQGAFVEVNCAAIPSELIESELFGHEKGAFTSAIKQHKGKFEQADGGTLFLDEVGDMSLSAQAKVLRALQENRISRVGGQDAITVNPRVIAATNKDLRQEIAKGNFREDLYHRLNVIPIHVPPLRERIEDIPLLVCHFVEKLSLQQNQAPKAFTQAALTLLQQCEWRGNVRELQNAVERLLVMVDGEIDADSIQRHVR